MKRLTLLLISLWVLLQYPSRGDDTEPLSQSQLTVLLQAVDLLEHSQIDQLKSGYNAAGKMSYYLRNATFLGRVKTAKNPLIALKLTFIRSSPNFTASLPSRSHTYTVFFDDKLDLILWREGGLLKGSYFTDDQGINYDLSDPKQYAKVIPDKPLLLKK